MTLLYLYLDVKSFKCSVQETQKRWTGYVSNIQSRIVLMDNYNNILEWWLMVSLDVPSWPEDKEQSI